MTYDPLADFDREILDFLREAGVDPGLVQLSTPPEREFGERATNVAFRLARERRQAPGQIAQELSALFTSGKYRFIAAIEPGGAGFLNFRLNYREFVPHSIRGISRAGKLYGRRPDATADHVVVEHTSVNPAHPWHVGHVRNAVLGDVVGRLLRLAGHEVEIQNYIDDTGLQAAQAVVGTLDFPEQASEGEKQDHYVGRCYVKVAAELGAEPELQARLKKLQTQLEELMAVPAGPRTAADDPGQQKAIQQEVESVERRLENIERLKRRVVQVMRELERGDHYPLIRAILDAQMETAWRLGIYYDLLIWESHLVASHLLEDAVRRLEEAPHVSRPETGRYAGALVIETGPPPSPGEEPKSEVLIRRNGIPTYVGKDIAYHMWKFHLLPDRLRYADLWRQPNAEMVWTTALEGRRRTRPEPDRVINVIGVHQSQEQAAVKEGLRAAGFREAAERLVHLDYGLVTTAQGRISGRRGPGMPGDSAIDEAFQVALERVQEKRSQDLSLEEMQAISESVAVGAVRYLMVQYNPLREIVFDVADVVSYDGNTGLYIQYALVRMFAILRKAVLEYGIGGETIENADASLLQHEQEKRLIYHLALFPGLIADASRTLAVNLVAEFAFDLATIFSQFYRDCQVLNAESEELRNARLLLVRTVRDVLSNACNVLGVPVIERL